MSFLNPSIGGYSDGYRGMGTKPMAQRGSRRPLYIYLAENPGEL